MIDPYQDEDPCVLITTKADQNILWPNKGFNMRNPMDVDEEDDQTPHELSRTLTLIMKT